MAHARLLDLTRSLRRVGQTATGIDRVERAYLRHLPTYNQPVFGLVRTAFGYLLLDQDGVQKFRDRLEGGASWAAPDLLSRFTRKRNTVMAGAEASLRGNAIARCLPSGLTKMLQRYLPSGFSYFNVGHSNLTDRVMNAVSQADGGMQVMIHDVIPLEHPEYQRAGTVQPFREKLERVSRLADRVIYNSEDTRQRAETQFSNWGRVPPGIVAHLGMSMPQPDASALPARLPLTDPYFLTLGTIEPRKNHRFLLDLWGQMGRSAPPLLICGQRGWNNADVFARLDELAPDSPIKELPGLSDAAIATLMQQSAGCLFPSHAEVLGCPR